jgi:hypothetical protein
MYKSENDNSSQRRPSKGRLVLWATSLSISVAALASLATLWLSSKPLEFVAASTAPEHVVEALKAMSTEQRDKVSKNVAQQLSKSPLDLTQILRLSALASARGDVAQSDALTLLAANRSHDDARLQANALQIELKRKNFPAALVRIDNLLKTAPQLNDDLFKTLIQFLQNGESFPAMVAKLATRPEWRAQFILTLASDKTVQAPILYALFSELRKAQSPETPDEMRSVLGRLIADKEYDKAYFMWVDSLSDVQLKKAGVVFDGGFELPIDNQYFSWNILPQTNVEARTVPRGPGSTDMVLRLDFSPGRTVYGHVTQLLRLAPGSYRLSGEAKAENLKTPNGMVWRIFCMAETKPIIASTARLVGNNQWDKFSRDFKVPEENCTEQTLRLELDAPTALDSQVEGSVSYDAITIEATEAATGG